MNKKERQEYYFNRLKDYVAKKRGKCLSDEYINKKTKMDFQCENGHIWKATPHTIIKCNCWCLVCAKEEKKRGTFSNFKKYVESKRG